MIAVRARAPDPGEATMKSVLIAEDHRDLAELLRTALEPLDVEVRLAFDGAQALQLAGARLPDLAVLDIGLPDVDGYEVCRRLRRLPGGERVRIVALTTWGMVQDRLRGADAGFDEHWTKPLGLELFRDLARRQLLAAGARGRVAVSAA
jgi:CheY-like chemotaxis protein